MIPAPVNDTATSQVVSSGNEAREALEEQCLPDTTSLILLIITMLVSLPALGFRLALTLVKRAAKHEESIDTKAIEAQKQEGVKAKAELDERREQLDTLKILANGLVSFSSNLQASNSRNEMTLDLLMRMQDAREDELGLRKHNSTLIQSNSETLVAMQGALDKQAKSAEANAAALPGAVRSEMQEDFKALQKLVEDLKLSVSSVEQKLDIAAKALQSMADRAPAAPIESPAKVEQEADTTKPVAPLFGNGLVAAPATTGVVGDVQP